MFTFLLVVQTLIAASLVAVILMQRSEGGGLGVSSSSAGLMTARGAADFLTRAPAVLAPLFIVLSIGLAALVIVAGVGGAACAAAKNAPPKRDAWRGGKTTTGAPAAPAPGAVPIA